MRDIYVCVIFLRVKIYWMFFYWSQFFDVHFSYCEVFMCQVLGGPAVISWKSRKQQIITLSSCEAEYISLSFALQEVIFLRQLCYDMTGKYSPVNLNVDNKEGITIAKN